MILVTGGKGQLAQALGLAARMRDLQVVVTGRPEFDFDHPATVSDVFSRLQPKVVINAAAFTAVDAAETQVNEAYRANADGPGQLAALCRAGGARMVHVSTDYVFDGARMVAYRETDATAPTGVYGASKLAGENAVRTTLEDAVVLRTSWVYAPRGKNFLLTMVQAARRGVDLRVVADQRGCPTSALDLAHAILDIVTQPLWRGGVYHAAGTGEATWHEFACAILDRAARHGLRRPEITPITTADWPTPARRPPDSRLDCGLLRETYDIELPHWRHSMARTVDAVMTSARLLA